MKKFTTHLGSSLQEKSALLLAHLLVKVQPAKPIKINGKAYALTLALLSAGSLAHAQGGGGGRVAAGASQIATTLINIVNFLLPAIVIIGVLICVIKAIRQQDFGSYALGVIAALIVWGGLNAFKEDIFGYFGGQTQLQIQ